MSGLPDIRLPREFDPEHRGFDHAWHVAINEYAAPYPHNPSVAAEQDGKAFLYQAKHAAHEVPRLALLFAREREGKLVQLHRQCSHDHTGQPVIDNHLTCCLGVECRKCPHLAALDRVQTRRAGEWESRDGTPTYVPREVPIPDEQRDLLKAWTCVTHILMRGGDTAGEGYVTTVDDRMYWDNVYASMRAGMELEDEADAPAPAFVDPAQVDAFGKEV